MQGLGLRGYQATPAAGALDINQPPLTDFLYKPGRTGGQSAFGGINSGDTLTLAGNPVDTNSVVTVNDRLQVLPEGTGTALDVQNPGTGAGQTMGNLLRLTASGFIATNSPIFINVIGPASIGTNQRYTLLNHQGTTLMPGVSVPFVLFNVAPVWELTGVKTAGQVFFFAPSIGDDGSVRTIGANIRMHIINPVLSALTAGSVGTVSLITGMDMTPNVDASWNPITTAQFISMGNPAGTHAVGITNLIGININDTITKPTNVWSIRNLEDRAQMYHRGSIAIGGGNTEVAATSLVHLRDNALDHTSITIDEVAADGPLPTLDNQARIYIKNNKFVIQWNLGGANLWTWAVLNPAGPYPVATAWVTDVVAP